MKHVSKPLHVDCKEVNMNSETKLIPRDVWKAFDEYWNKTEWKDLTEKDIKKLLGNGKYVFVPIPKEITKKNEAKIWYIRISEFKEKGKPFGNYHWTIDERGLNTTLGEILDMKEPGDVVPTSLTKKLYEWAKEKGYALKKE
jgi:hypothetical protein